MGHCLRVTPATFNKTQKEQRREHVAVLGKLPTNVNAAAFDGIIQGINAKSINIPRFLVSYKPKPFAYITFPSEETKQAAMEQTVAFEGQHLKWFEYNKINNLCHKCGDDHKPEECNI